jgi:triacylglycerol esterase/lipase EstA (alpha/beta hydrolase family)
MKMRNTVTTFGLLLTLAVGFSGAARAGAFPVAPDIAVGIAVATPDPAVAPPGANLTPCHSSVDRHPVILVNGTFSVMEDDFGALAPDLANAGYCIYTFNYGGANSYDLIQAVGPVAVSAQQLANFVSQVQAATGSAQVDLVGHSQGGLLAEYYAKVLHGAHNLHTIVALSPTTHGTSASGLLTLAATFPGANQVVDSFCPACTEQETNSAIVTRLDKGAIAERGVDYTIIETVNETVVTPVGSSFIDEPGVTNKYVQSFCPLDVVDHVDLPYDNVVIQLVKNALTPSGGKAPECLFEFPAPAS